MQVIRISIVAALVLVIVSFQNCARSNFELVGGPAEKNLAAFGANEDGTMDVLLPNSEEVQTFPVGEIEPAEMTAEEVAEELAAPVQEEAPVQEQVSSPAAEEALESAPGQSQSQESSPGQSAQSPGPVEEVVAAPVESGGSVEVEAETAEQQEVGVCILEGNGKSLKLGLAGSTLSGQKAMSGAVCISEKACLVFVAEKFKVQASYDRGLCNKNPNVTVLSDSQVQALLNK